MLISQYMKDAVEVGASGRDMVTVLGGVAAPRASGGLSKPPSTQLVGKASIRIRPILDPLGELVIIGHGCDCFDMNEFWAVCLEEWQCLEFCPPAQLVCYHQVNLQPVLTLMNVGHREIGMSRIHPAHFFEIHCEMILFRLSAPSFKIDQFPLRYSSTLPLVSPQRALPGSSSMEPQATPPWYILPADIMKSPSVSTFVPIFSI